MNNTVFFKKKKNIWNNRNYGKTMEKVRMHRNI